MEPDPELLRGLGAVLPPALLPGLSSLGGSAVAAEERRLVRKIIRWAAEGEPLLWGRRECLAGLVPGLGGPCAGEAALRPPCGRAGGPHRRAAPGPGLGEAGPLQRWTERGMGLRTGEGMSALLINPACLNLHGGKLFCLKFGRTLSGSESSVSFM